MIHFSHHKFPFVCFLSSSASRTFTIVCIIIPLTPGGTESVFLLPHSSSFFPTLTPTPPPTPLSPTAVLNHQRPSSRRSLSYEFSVSLRDLAPPAPFKQPRSILHSPNLTPLFDDRQSPVLPFSPQPSSPIPFISSPLPYSPTPGRTSPAKPLPSSTNLTPELSSAFPTTQPDLAISSSPTCRVSPSVPASQSKDSLVTRTISPVSLSPLPLISPSGSRCTSPCPSSPPLHSLTPCPTCQCTCATSVPPRPTQPRVDPSTAEMLF